MLNRSTFRALAVLAYATSLSLAALSAAHAQPETQSGTTQGSISTNTVTTFRADQTVEASVTCRVRMLHLGSFSSAGQLRFSFIDGVQKLQIAEAYTEKPDGR